MVVASLASSLCCPPSAVSSPQSASTREASDRMQSTLLDRDILFSGNLRYGPQQHLKQQQRKVRGAPLSVRHVSCSASATNGRARGTTSETLDVAGACVEPMFRSAPRPKESDSERHSIRVLFTSEGNVCRSVIAEAVFNSLVTAQGLDSLIMCESKAVRDYNVGESPEPLALEMAAQCGVNVSRDVKARLFKPAEDIVDFDIILVMDKFNAADVLKEVSVFDTIDPSARLSSRVRRLGDFCKSRQVGDIDDPLYGNMGGSEALEQLSDVVTDIQESCMGLLMELQDLQKTPAGEENLRKALLQWLRDMDDMDWLVPPMLQKR